MSNLSSNCNPKTALITGVSGFIGRYVSRHFFSQGWTVIGLDNAPPENAPLAALSHYHQLQLPTPELGDLLQKYAPDVCIHCAGRASVGISVTDPSADFYGNTVLTFELLHALYRNVPDCRFIFLSSAAVYGNPASLPVSENQTCTPLSPYGFHKLQCEQICLEFSKVYGLPTAIVRIFSAYGPGLRRQVLWDICRKLITEKSLKLQGTGQESRDFIHALDIAEALRIIAVKAPMQGEFYNLGTGREITIAELANIVLSALSSSHIPQFDQIVPVSTPLNWKADISKLQRLGFNPSISLELGVKTFAVWCCAELVGI